MVSVGQAESVVGIKKASKSEKKMSRRNLEFSSESGKYYWKLEKSCWKLDFFNEICIFFLLEIAGIWPNLAKSHQI